MLNRGSSSSSSNMGKQIIIDVTWLRPLKLIGIMNLLCGLICFLFSLILQSWVVSDEKKNLQFYMGLWKQCQKPSKEVLDNGGRYGVFNETGEEQDEYEWECVASPLYKGKCCCCCSCVTHDWF